MTDQTPEHETGKETGAVLLALGGLAAAFGAASCCALPILLGSFGVSSAWLFGIAVLSAPHRLALVGSAVLCLAGAEIMLALRWRAIACAPGSVAGTSVPSQKRSSNGRSGSARRTSVRRGSVTARGTS